MTTPRHRTPEYLAYQLKYREERREKLAADQRARYQAEPEKLALRQKDNRYHLGPGGFVAIYEKQGGRCAICRVEIPKLGPGSHVDHDHSCCSGKGSCGKCVREILCTTCNQGLGQFGDDPDTLRAAAAYLERHR